MSPTNDQLLRTASGTAIGIDGMGQSQLRRLAESPTDLLWQNFARPVKIGRSSLIVEAELPLGGRSVHVAYKRYCPRNWWKALCGLLRRSRALHGWHAARLLLAHDVATARPVAVAHGRGWRSRGVSYLATEWIAHAENLHQFGWRLAGCASQVRLRQAARCAESLGRLIGRMHAARIANRDLKGTNILVVQSEADLRTYLIDLDGVNRYESLSPARRAANLARLAAGLEAHRWVTPAVCRRFLRAYAEEFPPHAIRWKPLWRDVAARAARLVLHKRRCGKPLL